jgi:hypothetical protein
MCGLRISFGSEDRRYGGAWVVIQHAVALIAVFGVGVAVMRAQTGAQASSKTDVMQQEPGTAMRAPLNLQTFAESAQFSSSADENTDATFNEAKVTPAVPNFAAMTQYGGGMGRSNRPRYGSAHTNADGSDKWMGYGGGGFGLPVGNTNNYLTLGYGFQAGGGRQFSKRFALPVEFDWNHFGFTQQNLNNQTTIYNAYIYDLDPSAGTNALSGLVGGGSHVWSFSIEPTYTFYAGHAFGAYVVGGVGFYHKTAAFTVPALAYCGGGYGGGYGYGYGGGYGYGYGGYGGVCEANATFDKYTSNAPGFDGGAGITYKFSDTSRFELYGELRYVFVDNSSKPGITLGNLNAITATTTNFYPANSMHTEYIPFNFGIRF